MHLLVAQPPRISVKGDTSGHFQWVKSVALDCDGDALVVKVNQVGAACRTDRNRTCFDADVLLKELWTPMPATRREFMLALLASAAGAGLVVLAVRQPGRTPSSPRPGRCPPRTSR